MSLFVLNPFLKKLKDDAVRQMTKDNAEDLDTVISTNLAHQELSRRSAMMLALFRQVETFPDQYGAGSFSDSLIDTLAAVTELNDKNKYGEVALAAENIIRQSKTPGFEERVSELRQQLLDESVDKDKLSKSATLSAGVDLLTYLFKDEDANIRELALEVYIRRVYRAHKITDISVDDVDGRLQCNWTFKHADVPESQRITRHGSLNVLDSDNLDDVLPNILSEFGANFGQGGSGNINVLHIVTGDDVQTEQIEASLVAKERELNMLGVRTVNVLVPVEKKDPKYFSFPQCNAYKEDPIRRNMRPTFHHLLELSRLDANFNLERIPAVGRNAQIYIGSEKLSKPVRGGPPQVVFVRGVSHSPGLVSLAGARRALVQGMDELERAQANSKINSQSSSRIFLHSLPEIEGSTPEELAENFSTIMDALKSKLAPRLLKLRVDEIEVKVRVASTDDEGNAMVQPVRLVASSMEGEWLKTASFIENPDPVTGVTAEFCLI